MYDSSKDGIEFVNMWSKAATPLGRMISDFYHFPVSTPEGKFQSVEGYWYYLSLPEGLSDRWKMKYLYGWRAKQTGREMRQKALDAGLELRVDPDFESKILAAADQKIAANRNLITPELASLPIVHYYEYTGKDGVLRQFDVTHKFQWLIDGVTASVRKYA